MGFESHYLDDSHDRHHLPRCDQRCGKLGVVATRDDRWQRRARSFGPIAREYDRVRPSYPPAVIDDVVALLPGQDVAEIGAGTGKATVLLAARKLRMTSVEPDPEMAEVLADRAADLAAAGLPAVRIVVSSFEDWRPDQQFDGLTAAQSWHWTDPEHRYDRAARAIRPGGLLALFWNVTEWARTPISAELDDVYRRHGMTSDNPRRSATEQPHPWPRDELEQQQTFGDVEVRSYPWQRSYTSAEWAAYIGSTSDHLILPAERRTALLADVRRVIDAHGGELATFHRCDLYLARRTVAPAGDQ
jgi:SAM-dependent methyltransferase